MKDKCENNNSYRKYSITNIHSRSTTLGPGSVEYVTAISLIIRKDYKFLLCKYFHQHISLSERSENVRMKAGYLMVVIMYKTTTQRYYSPGMVNLVEEFVEYSSGQTEGAASVIFMRRVGILNIIFFNLHISIYS